MNRRSPYHPPHSRTLLEEVLEGQQLTPRELQVLQRAAEGDTAAETGRALYLAAETIKTSRKRLTAKLAARNLTNAVLGMRRGLIQ